MTAVWKSDLYRFVKSKLFYGIAGFTCLIAVCLSMLLWQDIRLGISVFGNLSIFKTIDDIVRIGIQYHKALGILTAILLSVFIGQEYTWQTWQNKWITQKSRSHIYLSKAILSAAVSASIFVIFEIMALLCSGQIKELLTGVYVGMMVSSVFIYAALGSVLCMISMLIKSATVSTIVCLVYVAFSETLVSIIRNISSLSGLTAKVSEWLVCHSIYGMSTIACDTSFSIANMMPLIINATVIILLSTTIGIFIFRRYDL